MSETSITRTTLQKRHRGRTDRAALRAITDEMIVESAASDPDAGPLDIDWSRAERVIPERKVGAPERLDTTNTLS